MKELEIIGKLGANAELITRGDKSSLKFTVAVNEKYKDNNQTHWFTCWLNGRPEHLQNLKMMFTKGQGIFVKGNFVNRIYQGKIYTDLHADKFHLV